MKSKLFVINETNGACAFENVHVSVFMLPEDSVSYEGTHITPELCRVLSETNPHDWEFIIGANDDGETLFWGRHIGDIEITDWDDMCKSMQKFFREQLKKGA